MGYKYIFNLWKILALNEARLISIIFCTTITILELIKNKGWVNWLGIGLICLNEKELQF